MKHRQQLQRRHDQQAREAKFLRAKFLCARQELARTAAIVPVARTAAIVPVVVVSAIGDAHRAGAPALNNAFWRRDSKMNRHRTTHKGHDGHKGHGGSEGYAPKWGEKLHKSLQKSLHNEGRGLRKDSDNAQISSIVQGQLDAQR